ncbi:hypothetical protein Bca4012_047153 [Brassica carinata]
MAYPYFQSSGLSSKKIEKLMGWIPCSGKRSKRRRNIDEKLSRTCSVSTSGGIALSRAMLNHMFSIMEKSKARSLVSGSKSRGSDNVVAQKFTFSELATATRSYRKECLIGEGGFGRVYKGYLAGTSQVLGFHEHTRQTN